MPISQGLENLPFQEKVRHFGSYLAHKIYDEVMEWTKVAPELSDEVKEIRSKVLPKDGSNFLFNGGKSSTEEYESLVAKGHEAIDRFFKTNQSKCFTVEAKANDPMNNFNIGVIPLPGMISSNGTINVKNFSKLGSIPDRAGYTKAGRGLMKHGYREGRTVFEKPVGNPVQINAHGQRVLDRILNHPEKVVKQYTNRKFGPVIEIEAPEMGGVRFTGDGKEMVGFIEPYWLKNKR